MNNNFYKEIFISLALIVLMVLFLNPFGLWMPNVGLMMLILGFLVVFAVFAGFVLRENAKDEREGIIRMFAGRAAFLSGAAVLVLAIIIQAVNHEVDPWLLVSLGAMVVVKIAGLIYGELKQ